MLERYNFRLFNGESPRMEFPKSLFCRNLTFKVPAQTMTSLSLSLFPHVLCTIFKIWNHKSDLEQLSRCRVAERWILGMGKSSGELAEATGEHTSFHTFSNYSNDIFFISKCYIDYLRPQNQSTPLTFERVSIFRFFAPSTLHLTLNLSQST